MKIIRLLPILFAISTSIFATEGYYRSPSIHDNTIVFTAEGDLWASQLGQTNARRLTTHPAEETQAAISPDGKLIAFAANYEGTTEAHIIPIDGGVAKRISFENSSVKVHGWTAKGDVIYSTNTRIGPTGNWTLKTVNPESLIANPIWVADAVEGVIDSKSQYVYFIQFGLQISGDNSKVYRGGAKGELWKYKIGSNKEAKKLTANHNGSVRNPMLYKDKIYFISDGNGNDTLWSMNKDGTNAEPLSREKEWPVRSASIHKGKIIYQRGADLWLHDLENKKISHLPIALVSDFPNLREHWVNKPLKYLNSAKLAGTKKKVVLTARGRVAIASTGQTRLVEVRTPKDSRTRQAILSNDGKWVYAINDASGEMEIWRFSADGSDKSKQLTKDGNIFRWQLSLSPDGKWLAHDDQNGDLWLLNLDKLNNKKIMSKGDGLSPYADLVWSQDSQLLAITQTNQDDERSRISLYGIDEGKKVTLTSDKYHSFSPAFSANGDWLYFLSNRHFNAGSASPWGDRNMGVDFDRRTEVFAYSLKANKDFPFAPENELQASLKKTDKKKKEKSKKNKVSEIDWKGIENRLWQVPLSAGNYSKLSINEKFLYVIDQVKEPETKPMILSLKLESDAKPETFRNNVADYALSNDGEQMFIQLQGNDNSKLYIVEAGAKFPKKTAKAKLSTSSWKLLINPQKEWQQMFQDAWIMHRDSLFDRNMRGLDWKAVKQKYQPLLSRITDRYELNDVFAQMMGELNTLHSQVRGGDYPNDEDAPKPALLGGIMKQSKDGVFIDHIYRYDNEVPAMASPLAKPGVNAKAGDHIVAVNGIKITSIATLNKALLNQANNQVLLSIKRRAKTHQTIVVPVNTRTDYQLRYNDWVTSNRTKVEKASNDIGYLHLHAMGSRDIADFAREFYAAYNKDSLIIDVRRNRGGNIDSWILEKLLKKAWMFWQAPVGGPSTNMQQTFRGHLVVLADQFTYSDGETFTAGVKALNLGPVIGKQTAGAGVWLRGLNRLVDGGMARVAEFPQYAMDGRWIVEGHGVEPTIEVDNLPHETFMGKDAQLESAIGYLKSKMRNTPIPKLMPKPLPKAATPADDILKN